MAGETVMDIVDRLKYAHVRRVGVEGLVRRWSTDGDPINATISGPRANATEDRPRRWWIYSRVGHRRPWAEAARPVP